MPLNLRIKPQAKRDLRAIALYVAQVNQDITSGQLVATLLAKRFLDIVRAPGMGNPYKEKPGVRKVNAGPNKIFYQIFATEVFILRLWDGRRGHDPMLT